jgi:ABC-type lipoprotein release transport system permease subunit
MGMTLSLRTLSRLESYPLRVAFWIAVGLGGLALALTLSGIFSVLSFFVEQRTSEIGVRMAIGGTPASVTRLVLDQSRRLVGVGLAAGGGLAWIASTLFTNAASGSPGALARVGAIVDVFDPVAYAGSLAVIAASCIRASAIPALRAARVDPIATLRHE